MPATFACPHCGASYPVKPVLVGRAVRCTTCRNAFRLRADGVADKVEDAAPTPPPPTPSPLAPITPPPPPSAPSIAHANGSAAAPAARTGTERHVRTDRLNRQQEDLRRSLAASLATVAEQALRVEETKPARESTTSRLRRGAKPAPAPGNEGKVGDIGPAVMTDQGVREHRERLMWFGGCLMALLVLGALVALILHRSPTRRALDTYTAAVSGERNRHPYRIGAIQERAWTAGVPPLIDAGPGASLGSVRRSDLGPARAVLAELKGLTFLGSPPVFAAADQADQVRQRWEPKAELDPNVQRLATLELRVVPLRQVEERLTKAIGEDAATALLRLMRLPPATADRDLGRRLMAGECPDALELCAFHGSKGTLLIDRGGTYGTLVCRYEGHLLRLVGAGWPDEWRALEIQTTAGDGP